MPRYRFFLPVRAVGTVRLPDREVAADAIRVTPAAPPAYVAEVDVQQGDNAEQAYKQAQEHAEHFFGYLALLSDRSAFILDGREGMRARNLDLMENPIPPDQPAPFFESIFGIITPAGQPHFAAMLDPDGNKRRSGAIVIHNAQATLTPGQERLNELCHLFGHRDKMALRVRIAVNILHDAASAREPASAYAQTFTALEVLTEDLRPPTLLDVFFQKKQAEDKVGDLQYKSKAELTDGLRSFFSGAGLAADQIDRLANYVGSTQSVSQVDIFRDYLAGLGIAIERVKVSQWRTIRGKLVHAAEANAAQADAMREFQEVVRRAVLEEIRRAAAQ